jgi:PAS domain S-box-containing protein
MKPQKSNQNRFNILAVDDNPNNLKLLSDTLINEGYNVWPVTSGKQALEIVKHEVPSLILLDIRMPEMSGYEVCSKLKSIESTRDIPVIFISALEEIDDKIKAFIAGGVDYITKPFQTREILARVYTHITLCSTQEKLQKLNRELEKRILERTKELELSNRNLQEEIRDRIRIEKKLSISEERFRRLVEGLDDDYLFYSISFDGTVHYVSPSVKALLGVEPEMLHNTNYQDAVTLTPDSVQKLKKLIRFLRKNIMIPESEIDLYHHDGTIRTLEIRHRIVFDDEIGKQVVEGIARDITERKKAEVQRMMQSTAMDQLKEIVLITDQEGIIQYVNPSFTTVTGYSSEEVLGNKPSILKSGRHDEEFYRELWSVIKNGHTWEGQLVNKRKDGQLYTEETTISPIRNKTGSITNFVAVKRDITQELRLEDQLRQAHRLEAIGTLAGGIAHDFNNILSPIACYTEMCLDAMTDESNEKKYLQRVLEASDRAKGLVEQILTFSRGKKKEKMPVKIKLILNEVLKLLRASIPSSIEIDRNLNSDSSIQGDPVEIHQIVMNLCTNAYHAMKETGGRLTITLKDRDLSLFDPEIKILPGQYVELTVRDTGHGIPKAIQDKIFDPYFTTKEKGEGTGLGLATVQSIVSQMGGYVKVDSMVDKGTAFMLFFPVLNIQQAPLPIQEKKIIHGGSETILIVDDEKDICDMFHRLLQNLGYNIESFISSLAALERFRSDPDHFNLILTDLTMPNMNGMELAHQALSIRPEIPVLLMSGYSNLKYQDQAKRIGIRAILKKPLVRNEITDAIRKELNKTCALGKPA